MSHYKKLFEETHIGKMKLRNRISMAPMGPVGYANSRGGFNQRSQLTGGHGAMPHMNYYMLTDLLNYHKVDIYTDTKVLKTTSDGVVVETDGTQKVLPAKTVIASIGYKENNMLYEQLKDSEIPVYNIGDSRQVHNIMYAI